MIFLWLQYTWEQDSDQLDSRFTLIRFLFEVESIESLEMSLSELTFLRFLIRFDFDSHVNHDSRLNRDSRRLKIIPNQNESV